MRWTYFLIAGWIVLLSVSEVARLLPTSRWFEIRKISVLDAQFGACPEMIIGRTIKRPFHANWVVTIMRRNASGGFSTYRTFPGENDYRPENELPDPSDDPPDLCWWTWQDDLVLPPGQYRVHTLYTLNLTPGGTREIRRLSNVFTVWAVE